MTLSKTYTVNDLINAYPKLMEDYDLRDPEDREIIVLMLVDDFQKLFVRPCSAEEAKLLRHLLRTFIQKLLDPKETSDLFARIIASLPNDLSHEVTDALTIYSRLAAPYAQQTLWEGTFTVHKREWVGKAVLQIDGEIRTFQQVEDLTGKLQWVDAPDDLHILSAALRSANPTLPILLGVYDSEQRYFPFRLTADGDWLSCERQEANGLMEKIWVLSSNEERILVMKKWLRDNSESSFAKEKDLS